MNLLKRKDWGDINPVTRTVPDKKKYSRKKKYSSDDMEQLNSTTIELSK